MIEASRGKSWWSAWDRGSDVTVMNSSAAALALFALGLTRAGQTAKAELNALCFFLPRAAGFSQ